MPEPDFDKIRAENDARLLGDVSAIRNAARQDALISFAKAYLGMFSIIDDCDDAQLRVHILANDELAHAILDGMLAALHSDYPSPTVIGASIAREEHIPAGYVLLAGMDLLARRDMQALLDLPEPVLKSGLCFHYANPCSHTPGWPAELFRQRLPLVAATLLEMWRSMIRHGTDFLPGYNCLYVEPEYRELVRVTVLGLLETWQACRDKTTRELLQLAMRFADREQLLALAERQLQHGQDMSVNRQVYWRATAFILADDAHATQLAGYVERSKERALRLLDFVYATMQPGEGAAVQLRPMAMARLIRMIAPKFTPREDAHGTLDEIERKVVWLFDQFERGSGDDFTEALRWLQGVRVMRGTLRYFDALPVSE